MRIVALGIAIVSLVACVADGEPSADLDDARDGKPCTLTFSFRGEGRAEVDRSAAVWNQVISGRICVVDAPREGARPIRAIEYGGDEWARLRRDAGGVAFIGLSRPAELLITYPLTKGELQHVLTHEMGHALGLGHVAGVSVMAPAEIYQPESLTPADVSECRRVLACS